MINEPINNGNVSSASADTDTRAYRDTWTDECGRASPAPKLRKPATALKPRAER